MKQSELTHQLLAEHQAATAKAQDLLADLSAAQLAWSPPSGGWGIAQVLEHLVVAADSYLDVMRPAITKAPKTSSAAESEWRGKLGGRLLVWSLRNPRKLPAPKVYQVGPVARANVFAEFLSRQSAVGDLFQATREVEWRRVTLLSPVSSLLRLNLGDAFGILVSHTTRHLGQMERIRGRVGFPS